MTSLKDFKKIDWALYLERKSCIFYVSIFFEAYKNALEPVTGFKFDKQLLWCKNSYVRYYRSEKWMKEARRYFLELIRKEDPRIQEWYKEGKRLSKKEEDMVARAAKMTTKEMIMQYPKMMKECGQFFLYLTSIPFLILGAIETDPEKHTKTREAFLEFRKESRSRLQELVFEKIWQTTAEKTGWESMDISYLTFQEVQNIFLNKEYPKKEEIEKRKKECIFFLGDNGTEFFYGEDLLQEIGMREEREQEKTKVKGNVAYKGIVQGKVCILNRIADMKKFEEGDIIVSINTNPSLMPALLKCKAIVADEGGLISHAAIIARELKKPCIIGKKIATKIFKDGDLIEVDAEKGIVKKLQ